MVMRFLRGLFSSGGGAGEAPRAEPPVEYNGFTITAAPEKGPGGWRVVGSISREIGGVARVHHFGRADTSTDRDAIVSMTIEKARRVIDEQGDRLFRDG
jgi:hypothetical protein